jgi:hypothetical protein
VCHRDPGLANWLDPAGQHMGPMIFRWLRADRAPVPETRVVPVDQLEAVLPVGTARVGPADRRRALAARRAAVRRRFRR